MIILFKSTKQETLSIRLLQHKHNTLERIYLNEEKGKCHVSDL